MFDATVSEGLRDLHPGSEIIVLTWLHHARRDVLRVHPRGNPMNPERGVFDTRSEDRPNPIGLHPVKVIATDANRILVNNLEAVDGTPILGVKPVIGASASPAETPEPARSRSQRTVDALTRLRTEVDPWVASADELGRAHLVPLSYHSDGSVLTISTPRASRTARNLIRAGWA